MMMGLALMRFPDKWKPSVTRLVSLAIAVFVALHMIYSGIFELFFGYLWCAG